MITQLLYAIKRHHVHGLTGHVPCDRRDARRVFVHCEIGHLYLPKLGFLAGVDDP